MLRQLGMNYYQIGKQMKINEKTIKKALRYAKEHPVENS